MVPRLRLLTCECQTVCLDPEWGLSMVPILHLWFCAFKTVSLASELLVSMGPRLLLLICECKTACLDPEWRLSIGPQPSSVVLCVQNSDFSIRITSLYGSQPSFVAFACKTAILWAELHVSMGPRLRLLICECQTVCLDPEWCLSIRPQPSSVVLCVQNSDFSIRITSLYGSQPSFVTFACKTAILWAELHVSMGPRLHLWFLHSKQLL